MPKIIVEPGKKYKFKKEAVEAFDKLRATSPYKGLSDEDISRQIQTITSTKPNEPAYKENQYQIQQIEGITGRKLKKK